jgi:hypothetical protein
LELMPCQTLRERRDAAENNRAIMPYFLNCFQQDSKALMCVMFYFAFARGWALS